MPDRGVKTPNSLKTPAEKQGKERSHPGGWAGMSPEGIGEAVPCGQRPGNPSHLFPEQHVIVVGPEAIGVGQGEVEHPHGESNPKNQPGVGVKAFVGVLAPNRPSNASLLRFSFQSGCHCLIHKVLQRCSQIQLSSRRTQ